MTKGGSYIDGEKLCDATLGDLALGADNHISVRIGIKAGARHVGGVNPFGCKFGNHPQDLVMRVEYAFRQGERAHKLK